LAFAQIPQYHRTCLRLGSRSAVPEHHRQVLAVVAIG
jgi:hypothetical protein